jgi:biotin carboxylase
VLKPSDCSGQAGTTLIHTQEELTAALAAAVSFATDRWAIVEEYVAGPEINVCAVVTRSKAHILSLSDRITADPPHFGIAIRHALPALLSAEQYQLVSEASLRAIEAIGLTEGIAYPQVLVGPQGPRVVEIAARIPGGNMREVAMWSSGIDMIRIAILQAMNESFTLEKERSSETYRGVAVEFITRLSVPENIRVAGEIRGLHEAEAMPGIKELQFKLKKGDDIPALTSSRARFGSVVAVGDTQQEALQRAASAARHIEISAE